MFHVEQESNSPPFHVKQLTPIKARVSGQPTARVDAISELEQALSSSIL